MEHPWTLKYAGKTLEKHLPEKATSSSAVSRQSVKTDMSMEFDSSFTKTLNAITGC